MTALLAVRAVMTEGSLFTGYNGLGIASAAVMDTEPSWFCDNDPAASAVLAKHWPIEADEAMCEKAARRLSISDLFGGAA